MKRKGIIILAVVMLLISVCAACGSTNEKEQQEKESQKKEQQEETDKPKKEKQEKEEKEETEESEEEKQQEAEREKAQETVLGEATLHGSLIQEDKDFIYVCGNHIIRKIDKKNNSAEVLWEGEQDFWEDESQMFNGGSSLLIGDTLFFLEAWPKEEEGIPFYEGQIPHSALAQIQTDGSGYKRLRECGDDTLGNLLFMDGVLYFDKEEETGNLLGMQVEADGSVTKADTLIKAEYHQISPDYWEETINRNGYCDLTVAECEKKLGYALMRDEEYQLVMVSPQTGEKSALPEALKGCSLVTLNEHLLLFAYYPEEGVEYYLVDNRTFEKELLATYEDYMTVIVMDEDYLYLKYNGRDEHQNVCYRYERVNLLTKEREFLFQEEGFLGTMVGPEYLADITLHNGYLYYMGMQDYRFYLMRRNVENPDKAEVLGDAVSDSGIGKVGTVEKYYREFYGKESEGKLLAWVELESLCVDERYPGAGEINRQLLIDRENIVTYEEEMVAEMESWISENEDYGFPSYSSTSYIGEITYFDHQYLSFCQEGYDYFGGAHGMPVWIGYTFDLQTGKRLELSDVLSNSEEELKEIVTAHFTELINQNPELFWEDAIETVTQYTDMSSSFYLTGEGIHFYFEPYMLASYAAGFQEVTIPYDVFEMKIPVTAVDNR